DPGSDRRRQAGAGRGAARRFAGARPAGPAAVNDRRNRARTAWRAWTPVRRPARLNWSITVDDVERVEKPWGYELRWAKTDRYVGKIIHVKAGEALSLQYHKVKDE